MSDKKKVSIFLIASIIFLILVGIMFNYIGEIINYKNRVVDKIKDDDDNSPEYIYETFLDKDKNEVVIEMEKKTGTMDGEDIVFYEDTSESEVIYCHFYQGIVQSVNGENVIFLVDKEYKNADLNESYYDYKDVDDYEIEFNLNDYRLKGSDEFGISDSIAINTNEIRDKNEIGRLKGKYITVQDTEFIDSMTKNIVKNLDFYIR